MTDKAKPASGRIVPYPGRPGEPLASEGERVTWDSYWLRRLRAGDVIRVSGEPAPKPEAPKAKVTKAKNKPEEG